MAADPWAAIAAADAETHRIHVVFRLFAAALWMISAGTTGIVIIAAVVANYAADQPERLISILLMSFSAVVLSTITLAGTPEIEQESRARLEISLQARRR